MSKVVFSLLAAAALAATLAACGGGEPVSLAAAAAATRDAQTARVQVTTEVEGLGLPSKITLTGSGVTSLTRCEIDLKMDLGPLLAAAGVGGSGATRVLVDGSRVYVDPPAVEGVTLPAEWFSLDVRRVVEAMGLDADALGDLINADPAAQLEVLTAGDDVEEVGEEQIDGADTTHYRGTFRTSDIAKALPEDRRKRALAALEKLGSTTEGKGVDDPTPFDVWIDHQDRIRRMTQRVTSPAQAGTPGGTLTMTFSFSDYGTELSLDPPPAGETFDVTALAVEGLQQTKR